MRKRKPKLTDEWLRDVWNVRGLDYGEGELEDFDKLISSAVARCLREDDSRREGQARDLSYLLAEEVSAAMLDAYSSEARRSHRIPASRFLVLIAMTRRFDILDAVLREVGGKALDRHDAKVFRVGVDYVNSVGATRALHDSLAEVISPL
jgi:hypothetical protein